MYWRWGTWNVLAGWLPNSDKKWVKGNTFLRLYWNFWLMHNKGNFNKTVKICYNMLKSQRSECDGELKILFSSRLWLGLTFSYMQ